MKGQSPRRGSAAGLRVGLPRVGLPRVGLPRVGLPRVGLPRVGLPRMGLPRVGVQGPLPGFWKYLLALRLRRRLLAMAPCWGFQCALGVAEWGKNMGNGLVARRVKVMVIVDSLGGGNRSRADANAWWRHRWKTVLAL
jgi:hypothetical protein